MLDHLRDDIVVHLNQQGFSVPASTQTDAHAALLALLRVAHRSIPARRRAVHFSSQLQARMHVLAATSRVSLHTLISELERGVDVNQRLTRKHFVAGFNDVMQNDLGVRHLHLGLRDQGLDKTRRHKMCAAGDDLLWVVIHANDAYALDLLPHSAFATFEFPQVLYDNCHFCWAHRYLVALLRSATSPARGPDQSSEQQACQLP